MKRGFTLIELLVVIAIIAILSVVVILTLNPAELLRQSRDSNRISDLSVTKSGLAFYLASATNPTLGSSSICYVDAQNATGTTLGTSTCAVATGGWFASDTGSPLVASTTFGSSTLITGLGWIPVPFNTITAGGSPLSALPRDPVNNDGIHFYSYAASGTGYVFKLDAHMESAKYSLNGPNDVVSKDGGLDSASYEFGTNLTL